MKNLLKYWIGIIVIGVVIILISTIFLLKQSRTEHFLEYTKLDTLTIEGDMINTKSYQSTGPYLYSLSKNNLYRYFADLDTHEISKIELQFDAESSYIEHQVISGVNTVTDVVFLIGESEGKRYLTIVRREDDESHDFKIINTFPVSVSKLVHVSRNIGGHIIGVEDDNQTIVKYSEDGNGLLRKKLPTQYIFPEYISQYCLYACGTKDLIFIDPETLEIMDKYPLKKEVELNKIIPPKSFIEDFIVDNEIYEIVLECLERETKIRNVEKLSYSPKASIWGHKIKSENSIDYGDGTIITLDEGFKYLRSLNIFDAPRDGFRTSDVFIKQNKLDVRTEIVLICRFKGIKNKSSFVNYHIVKVEPFNDIINDVFEDRYKADNIYFIGENSTYKSIHPKHWKYINKVETVKSKN